MLVYDAAKIAPRLDTRHVHEHRVLAKIPGEIIEQAARLTFGVFSPITDEDGAHVTPSDRTRIHWQIHMSSFDLISDSRESRWPNCTSAWHLRRTLFPPIWFR